MALHRDELGRHLPRNAFELPDRLAREREGPDFAASRPVNRSPAWIPTGRADTRQKHRVLYSASRKRTDRVEIGLSNRTPFFQRRMARSVGKGFTELSGKPYPTPTTV